MNSKLILLATVITVATSTNAQNFGGKVGEKMNAKIQGTAGPSKKQLEEAAADSSSTFLDSKEVLKDARGISGIYYSASVISAHTKGDNPMTNKPYEKIVKKFLVNYDETNFTISLNTQYAYETSNNTKWVKAATWTSVTSPKKLGPEISIKAGGLYLSHKDYDNRKYQYAKGYGVKEDLQGNYVQGDAKIGNFNNAEILEIEPGILLIGDLGIGKDGGSSSLEIKKKYEEVIVLYKADKADVAAKYTREYAWDKINEFWKKYKVASDEIEASSTELAKPIAGKIKDEPSNADLRKAVEDRMTQYKWGETLEYVYIVTEWKNEYKKIGVNQLNTLVSRSLQVQVVTKKGDKCRATMMIISQENISTTGSVQENFGGQPIKASGNGPTNDIDCKRAYEHKK
jgi:hypothetical protein